ncbi:transcription factor YdeB [Bacillus aerolatus]|uniref:Transcription factor YdeB n=1 Tax=Bacillus aerolatus TaxID=2653354 RepID=A0A6I1FB48_9BACI|nr:CarD family transcriptional regulator [Bacillus aerolatus]KAB7704198.1 transcription factor YdeB [Bacillus aerolatus]
MFQIGDKVFYPMYGAGIIEAIEEKEILGKKQEYCVITIPLSKMDVMIPTKAVKKSRVRLIVDRKEATDILFDFHNNEESVCSLPWKERLNKNTEKMKTGEMHDTAEVVRDLLHHKKVKALNSSEKQMLDHAMKFLISELILIKDITENEAADLLKLSS